MTVSLGAATITFVLDDIGTLETLRDDLTAVIEHLNARHESDQPDDEDDPHEHPPRQWQGHAPSALRDEFDEWALMRRTPGTVTPEGRALFEDEIATPLSACTDALPYHYCNLLGLPHGSTYAEGVEKLRDGM